ncbi:MAG: lipopolysaccharide heptosyltransferase I [Legionellales bacterium]|nr:lipopolysaccharide heptosyltransferase I [Legionellales bacterium]
MKKILVVKMSSMGDIIHAFPALNDAKNRYHDLECHWLVDDSFYDITRLNNDIDMHIKIPLRRCKNNFLASIQKFEFGDLLKRIRQEKYDYIIDPQGLLKSALLSCIARGKRYGYDFRSIREPAASIFYNKKFSVSKSLHAITRIRKLFAKSLNYEIQEDSLPSYNLVSEQVQLKFAVPDSYVIFLHGTSRANKCWSEEKWIDLAGIFAQKGMSVLVLYSNQEEYQRANRIVNNSTNVSCIPKCSLWEIACLIRNAKGLIGLDTGLTHLAAAYNIPMVSLYGPTATDLIGTLGSNQVHKDLYATPPDEVYTALQALMLK